MAAEREPPPLGDGRPTDFEEQEDGEDLFTSTVSTLERSLKLSVPVFVKGNTLHELNCSGCSTSSSCLNCFAFDESTHTS